MSVAPLSTTAPAVADVPLLVRKRDGSLMPFDPLRIERAIALCFMDIGHLPRVRIQTLAAQVIRRLRAASRGEQAAPTVEQIQDLVEEHLLAAGEETAARHYRSYRAEHAAARAEHPIPDAARAAFAESASYFPTALQQFQFVDKYARFDPSLGRRETWPETVSRAVSYLAELVHDHTGQYHDALVDYAGLTQAILRMEVLPSMRLLAMAGPAARRNNATLYNCAYLPVEDQGAFGEALLISMSGCGVGYSVERQFAEQFPRVQARRDDHALTMYAIGDSAEGWKAAVDTGIEHWLSGRDIAFDYRSIRPAGAVLKTKGGRASGPAPLKTMLDGLRRIVQARAGTVLRPIDLHDMMCLVGGAAVSGGMRRTAMLALFDGDDTEMARCKDGDLTGLEHRYNANNSAVLSAEHLTQTDLMAHFVAMDRGQRGEPGIFFRTSLLESMPTRRYLAHNDTWRGRIGVNPCGEIILPAYSFCNLSAVVARADDTLETLAEKARKATLIGTIQSLATHFPGLRPQWAENCREERLLGVDITGQMDCPLLHDLYAYGTGLHGDAPAGSPEQTLYELKQVVLRTNEVAAETLHIPVSAATTCTKPSGNSSQLVDCASGLHPRFAPYYLRRVRVAATSPVYAVLRAAGVPLVPEVGQDEADAVTWVAEFPVAAPEFAVTRAETSALDQCTHWLRVKAYYTEHNPSVTITYRPEEVLSLVGWVWEHRDQVGGMSFLPASDARYALAPYEEISKAEYHARALTFPVVDWAKLLYYEASDLSEASGEVACTSGQCEV